MAIQNETIAKPVVDAIERVIRLRMSRYGFREAQVRGGLDHDGDPVLFIEALYD